MIKYSESEHSCYNMLFKYKKLPEDLIEISNEEHKIYWMSRPPQGKVLAVGYPFKFVDIPKKDNDELFNEEMDKLNKQYDKDMLVLVNEYNIAVVRDASEVEEKALAARVKVDNLDAKYDSDQAKLIQKYYGDQHEK